MHVRSRIVTWRPLPRSWACNGQSRCADLFILFGVDPRRRAVLAVTGDFAPRWKGVRSAAHAQATWAAFLARCLSTPRTRRPSCNLSPFQRVERRAAMRQNFVAARGRCRDRLSCPVHTARHRLFLTHASQSPARPVLNRAPIGQTLQRCDAGGELSSSALRSDVAAIDDDAATWIAQQIVASASTYRSRCWRRIASARAPGWP